MNSRNVAALVFAASLSVQCIAFADFIHLPVKWSQPIETNDDGAILGVARASDDTIPWVMADDFLCNDPLPVMAVRWWGSYYAAPQKQDSVGFTVAFDIGFHSSSFPDVSHPNSKPVNALLFQSVLAQEEFVGIDGTGDFVYRYDAYLTTPFPQVPGTEYFISIDKPTGEGWGWQDSAGPHPQLDWAALSPFGDNGPWFTFNPKTDLAFEIMIPEPNTAALSLLGGGLLLGIVLRRRT